MSSCCFLSCRTGNWQVDHLLKQHGRSWIPSVGASSCVTASVLAIPGGYRASNSDNAYSAVLSKGSPIRLTGTGLAIRLGLHFRVLENARDRAWYPQLTGYWYTLREHEGREILAYHWHQEGHSSSTAPHLHLSAAARVGHPAVAAAHLPTGIVGLDDFLRMLIEEFGVRPRRRDWDEVLRQSTFAFDAGAS